MRGDTLFTIGAVTAVVSVAGYAVACGWAMALMLLDVPATPDAMAIAVVAFFAGLALMAAGWTLGEFQKGT